MSQQHLVAVVGAGPAGIYGTRKLTEAGHRVVLLNRDIKPGGLAEYGIFVDKEKMKTGLRKQFKRILADPKVFYLGHVTVGQDKRCTLKDLQGYGIRRHRRYRRRAGHKETGHRGRRRHRRLSRQGRRLSLQFACRPSASGLSKSAGASRSSAWATSWSISPTGCSI